MEGFFNLVSPEHVLALLQEFPPLGAENAPLHEARGRILARELVAGEPVPPFSRSTMDGYAVRAADTFGCSESQPALLTLTGEIAMGSSSRDLRLRPGQAARIWTGGELPPRADAVAMVEHTQMLDPETVTVFRPVAPGTNVIQVGEDIAPGAVLLDRGHCLRPQDLGLCAGLGLTSAPVRRRPRVGVLSTGNELIPPGQDTQPGKIRDMNSTTLQALVEEAGGVCVPLGICGDDHDALLRVCANALPDIDMLLVSGGSSVGRADFTARVFSAIPGCSLLAHGVAIRPGKPTILARQGDKALWGLPGHAASAMVVFYCFVRPLLRQYAGLGVSHGLKSVRVLTAQQIPSVVGREDYVRVRLTAAAHGELPLATPIYGKSGLLRSLVRADGLLAVGRDVEGLDQGVESQVLLFP
ncbi:molybdopterin molybdotransferase MoeA [Fundidesulfovibrio butyratiphilus]